MNSEKKVIEEKSGMLVKAWGAIGSVLILTVFLITLFGTSKMPETQMLNVDFSQANGEDPDDLASVMDGMDPNATIEFAPLRLIIPKINVEAAVESVGLTNKGNMAVPRRLANVGWYSGGVKPGEPGNAVIAGHLDNAKGKAGIFINLKELAEGDLVTVQEEGGKDLVFKVVKTAVFDYNDAPLKEIFGESSVPRLNLITCDGTWLSDKKTYDKRLIVFTELVF